MRAWAFGGACAFVFLMLAGCGGSRRATPPVGIAVMPTSLNIGTGMSKAFMASVTGSSNTAVTWSLSGTGCSGTACGTLSSTGANPTTYTAPATAPTPNMVTLTVTSSADSTKTATAMITILNAVSVSVSPMTQTFVAGASAANFTAAVMNGADQVTWALTNGSGCNGAACGMISNPMPASVTYTPPSSTAASFTVMLTATSTTDTTKSGSATITVVPTTAALLTGQYAFQLTGFTSAGLPIVAAGSFTADGQGHITTGEEDVNTNGSHALNSSITGTYTFTSAATFSGSLVFSGGVSGSPVFALAIDSAGKTGSLLETDGNGNLLSGALALQDSTAIATAPTGNFAFEAVANAAGPSRTGEIGRFTLTSGSISNGLVDTSTTTGIPLNNAALTGSFSAAPDANGRGTAQLTPGSEATGNFAYYVVNAGEFLLVSTDAASAGVPLLAGLAAAQNATLDNTALNLPSVFCLTGLDAAGNSSVVIGQLQGSSSSGNLTLSGTFDANDGGTITGGAGTSGQSFGGNFTNIAASNGRGQMTFQDVHGNTLLQTVFYLTQPGQGFLMDFSPNPTQARTGQFQAQNGGPFSGAAVGNFTARQSGTATDSIPNAVGVVTGSSTGMLSGSVDKVIAGGATSVVAVNGTDGIASSNGRGTAMIPNAPFGSMNMVFYLISPAQLVAIGADSGNASGVAVFSQQ